MQAAHQLVNTRIREFQAGVVRRAAAQAADPRWLHQKALSALSSWDGVRGALAATRPTPWGAVVLLMIGSFVRSVIEQFAQARLGRRCRHRACAVPAGAGAVLFVVLLFVHHCAAQLRAAGSPAAVPLSSARPSSCKPPQPSNNPPLFSLLQDYVAERDRRLLQAEVERLCKQQ